MEYHILFLSKIILMSLLLGWLAEQVFVISYCWFIKVPIESNLLMPNRLYRLWMFFLCIADYSYGWCLVVCLLEDFGLNNIFYEGINTLLSFSIEPLEFVKSSILVYLPILLRDFLWIIGFNFAICLIL